MTHTSSTGCTCVSVTVVMNRSSSLWKEKRITAGQLMNCIMSYIRISHQIFNNSLLYIIHIKMYYNLLRFIINDINYILNIYGKVNRHVYTVK